MSSKPSVPRRASSTPGTARRCPTTRCCWRSAPGRSQRWPGAITFAGPRDVLAIRETIEALAPGRRHTIAFVAMADAAWTLPLYELALMTAEYGRRHGLDLAIELFSYESAPLGIFGAAASSAVRLRLNDAGIRFRTGTLPTEHAVVIALPALRGPGLHGLRHDPDGFVRVDDFGRIHDVDRVWAVGDMTARPLKQGGLAAQQADVAAADIAAQIAGVDVDVQPYRPKLQGVLLTGAGPLYLQHDLRAPVSSQASREPLWWPPQKVAGAHLGPYLETLDGAVVG